MTPDLTCVKCGRSNPPGGVGQLGTSGWRCVEAASCDLTQAVTLIRRDAERFPRSCHSLARHALADRVEHLAAARPVTPPPSECDCYDPECGYPHGGNRTGRLAEMLRAASEAVIGYLDGAA